MDSNIGLGYCAFCFVDSNIGLGYKTVGCVDILILVSGSPQLVVWIVVLV